MPPTPDSGPAALTRIAGLGAYLPGEAITNERLAERFGREVIWIAEMLGARTRHFAVDLDTWSLREGESNADMARKASQRALVDAGIPARSVDLIVLATSTPDYPFPATALFVQEQLGLEECQTIEFRAGCGGMAQAFIVADQFIRSGRAGVALVIGSDLISPFNRLLHGDPRARKGDLVAAAMFGDGAGAAVLVPSSEPGRGILGCMCRSVGGGRPPGMILRTGGAKAPAGLDEPGGASPFVHDFQAILKHGPELMERAGEWIFKADVVPRQEIKWWVPPQVSGHLIESMSSHPELRGGTVFSNFAEVGNTASASIYIALDAMRRRGLLQRGDVLALLPAEGTKWTYGAIVVRW